MSQLQVGLSAEGAKNVSWPWVSPLWGWGSLTLASTGTFLCMVYHFILLGLNLFGLRLDSDGWWFEHSMSQLRVCLSEDGPKNVSWLWQFRLRGLVSLTLTSTGIFVCMAHHLILLWLSHFGLRVDIEGWWLEHSLSQLRVCLSTDGGKSVSLPWVSPLGGWRNLTMTYTAKFVYMAHHFILLKLNPIGLRVDSEGWWFEHSM